MLRRQIYPKVGFAIRIEEENHADIDVARNRIRLIEFKKHSAKLMFVAAQQGERGT